jgi:AraC-like DNA-binding protein
MTDSTRNVHRPLDSFPILRSGNLEEIRQGLIKSYKPRRLNFPHRAEMFELYANHWQSQSLGLSYVTGVPFQLEFPTEDFFRQAFILGGADIRFDRTETRLTNGATCVLPPDSVATAAFNPGYEHFGLRIKADALLNKLAALIDATPSRKLVFDQTARVDDSRTANIRRLVTFFAGELDSTRNALSPTLVELEQALIVAFLCNNPHNYSVLLETRPHPAASWQVRRAEEYIEAHWDQPITIEDLARETSSSSRSLFRQFRNSRGQTPMGFLKDVRLRHARDMLERSELSPSVTEIAMACGFGNLGHFATDYFRRFGERPSDTLKRNNSLAPQAAAA